MTPQNSYWFITPEKNFKEQLNEDNKAVLQMFADSSSQVTVAGWEKVLALLFISLVEEITGISINRSRDCKGP